MAPWTTPNFPLFTNDTFFPPRITYTNLTVVDMSNICFSRTKIGGGGGREGHREREDGEGREGE